MRSLVTGGAGFIGSTLVDLLAAGGDEVHVIDNLSTGRRSNLDAAPAAVTLHEIDVLDDAALARAFDEARPQRVFHLAAQIDVRLSLDDPAVDAGTNVLGTLGVLRQAHRTGVEVLVNTSTGGAIYGDAAVLPTPEEAEARPLAPYGVSKRCAEEYVAWFARERGLRALTLRLGNVYGPRQDPLGEAGVVAIFCERALAGGDAVVFGDGRQTRDFVHVADVAAAQLAAAERGESGRVYNVGTSTETSVVDLTTVLAAAGHPLPVRHTAARVGEVRRSCLETSRVQRELGWAPAVALQEGLAGTLAWLADATCA